MHQKASVILAAGFLVGGLAWGDVASVSHAVGSLVGILVGPDQDVDSGNISNTILKNRIGKWAERGWSLLWYFYRGSIKHGSPLSHAPVISTIVRLAYLYLFLIVIPYTLVELALPGAWDIGAELQWWGTWILRHWRVILGLIGSDTIHYFLDVLTQEHKHRKSPLIFGVPLASGKCNERR